MSNEDLWKFYSKVFYSCETTAQLNNARDWMLKTETFTRPSMYWAYLMGVSDALFMKGFK